MQAISLAAIALGFYCVCIGSAEATTCTGGSDGGVSVTGATLALGSYDPSARTADVVPFSVTLACTGGSGLSTLPESSIALSAGSGSYSDREMQQGNTMLEYQVFTNAGLSTVWGDGSGATSVIASAGGTSSQQITGYGVIPPGQWIQPGIYTDTLTITVSY